MTITQEDMDAAINAMRYLVDDGVVVGCCTMSDYEANEVGVRLSEAFARHREAAYAAGFTAGGDNRQAKIVAWLRAGGRYADWDNSMNVRFLLRLKSAWLSFRRPWTFAKAGQRFAADAIEAGEPFA